VAHRHDREEDFPVKAPKTAKPHRHAIGFAVFRGESIWLRKRPAKGLLGGMLEVPSTEWRTSPWTPEAAKAEAPLDAAWQDKASIGHVFTHFSLEMAMWRAEAPSGWQPETGGFHCVSEIGELALPSVMKKAVLASL
jgi:A/G-specific adenine glycosylase